jgi:short-subunit dehydrogenase
MAFARRGARLGLLARDAARLEELCRAVEQAGGRALALSVDVTDAEAVEDAADRVEDELGPIEVWINSAMATVFAPVSELTPKEFDQVTATTYLGTVYGTMAALRRMEPRNRGTIVQVGSALAYRSIPLQAAYCGAKAAVRGFTDSLRSELIYEGSQVKLTMVQLGAFNTPQFDWGRNRMPRRPQPVPPIYQPEVAARAIVWAAAHPRREVNVGAASVLAKLGQKLLPGFMDWHMARQAWEGQMTEAPAQERDDNLFAPVPGDYGSHGRFDDQAKSYSLQFELSRRRGLLGSLAAGAAVAAVAGWAGARRQRRSPLSRLSR